MPGPIEKLSFQNLAYNNLQVISFWVDPSSSLYYC